ncbi:unnamed protein product [Pleuronectes platessa]|uniref:Uncharacterized protein n=1 Tax=Pleuronectes platessa TaxID=8262 RepID=A0A9N7YXG4_PLEPL|nr:unnamed protein product [Pleuronectes platessa]
MEAMHLLDNRRKDLHVTQGAVDSSVDMDRLNRNMPECGRQTHQVLQVSLVLVCVVAGFRLGEMGEKRCRARKQREEE